VTTSFDGRWAPGGWLAGKWNRNTYRIIRKLGEGANGCVYLVQKDRNWFALKIGFDTADLQSEVNALTALSRTAGPFSHFLLDADDCVRGSKTFPFYVMKYVEGRQAGEFIMAKGKDWVGVVGLRLLGVLAELHGQGWIFSDLKAENVLVSGYGDVHLVDFGGLTRKGKAVKQFTELYDRGYWNAGERTADEGYDLFAFGMLCLHLLGVKGDAFSPRTLPQNRSPELLLEAMAAVPECRKYAPCLRKLLTGGYAGSREAREHWRTTVYASHPVTRESGKSAGGWLKTGIAVSLVLLLSAIYLYFFQQG
jgi:serine/threonine-protein kinase